MEKEFVPYELAVKLKALGFDEPCFGYWYTAQEEYKKIEIQLATIDFLEGEEDYILALTFQQAFRWFREKYQLQSEILWITDMNCFWYKTGKFKYSSRDLSKDDYKTYEEAELACLDKLIEIVENEKTL